jgi:hypothetical protein
LQQAQLFEVGYPRELARLTLSLSFSIGGIIIQHPSIVYIAVKLKVIVITASSFKTYHISFAFIRREQDFVDSIR